MSPLSHIHVHYHRALAYWNRLIGLEQAAKATPDVQTISENDITHLPYDKTPSIPARSEISPMHSVAYAIVGILFFLPGFFFYKSDLPAEASFGTMVRSRLLLLTLDGLIVFAFLSAFKWLKKSVPVGLTPAPGSFWALFIPLVYALVYLHTTYIWPLHFWPQALQFIIN